VTRLTLSCTECGSGVNVAKLHGSDADPARTAVLQVRCPACRTEGTVEMRASGVTVSLEGDMSFSTPDATAGNGRSLSASSGDTDDTTRTSSVEDSVATTSETDAASGEPTAEPSANQASESESERETASDGEPTSETGASEPDGNDSDDYETVLDELDAVRGAGVKNLRDRSEVEGVARAVGHDTLLAFLQDADDATYRTAVQEATEPHH
jgi:hypothetical protein